MTSILGRLFPDRSGAPAPSRGDQAYAKVMREVADLEQHMREVSVSTDPARSIMATVWLHRHNTPFMTTTYEAAQEMKSGPESNRK